MRLSSGIALLAALLGPAPCFAAAAAPCPVTTASFASPDSQVLLEKVTDAYRRLVRELGAGVLSQRDLLRLRDGDPFSLEPGGQTEAMAVADGLRRLGEFARERFGADTGWQPKFQVVLDEALAALGVGTKAAAEVVRRNAHPPKPVRTVDLGDDYGRDLSLSSDGKWIAAYGLPGKLGIFDVRTGERVIAWNGNKYWASWNVKFSPDRSAVLVGTTRSVTLYRHGSTGEWTEKLLWARDRNFETRYQMEFAGGGRAVLVGEGNELFVYDGATGKPLRVFRGDWIEGFFPSPDGSRMVVGTTNGGIRLFGETLWRPRWWHWLGVLFAESPVEHIEGRARWGSWSADSRNFVAWNDREAVLLDGITLEPGRSVRVADVMRSFQVSPSGRYVLARTWTSQGHVLDMETGATGAVPEKMPHRSRSFFAGDDHLWSAGPGALELWSLGTGKRLYEYPWPADGCGVHTDRTGLTLLTSKSFREVQIWDGRAILGETSGERVP